MVRLTAFAKATAVEKPDVTYARIPLVGLFHCLRNSGDCTSATNRLLNLNPDALNWSYSWSIVFSSEAVSSLP